MKLRFLVCIASLACSQLSAGTAFTPIADFESGSWGDWTVEGKGFGERPCTSQNGPVQVQGGIGNGFANSFILPQGDRGTGKLISPAFRITAPFICFRIAGGKDSPEAPLGMRLEVDGQILRTASGENHPYLEWVNWDVSELKGKMARLVIEDAAVGRGGYVAVDQVGLSEIAMPAFAAASLFCDQMVLQRDVPVAVWGTAQPGDKVSIRFAEQTKETQADAKGAWRVMLDPMPASAQGRELTLSQKGGETVVIKDVLVGEVWLASGQSNMGMGLGGALNGKAEVAAANFPNLRFFSVPTRASHTPEATTPGSWMPVSPDVAAQLSGVAYFFSREIHRKLDIPVGVIVSAVGGTPGEAWTPREVLAKDTEWSQVMTEQYSEIQRNEEYARNFPAILKAWRTANHCEEPEQPKTEWAQLDYDTADWGKASGRFPMGKKLGLTSGGVIWLRKEIEVPEAKAGKALSLSMDFLDRQIMTVYLNGKELGTLGNSGPRYYQTGLLMLPVPAGAFKAGRNVLAIRCTNFTADSTKVFSAPKMRLPVAAPEKLDDEWLIKTELAFPSVTKEALEALPRFTNADLPQVGGGLYNAMIAPLIPYTIRGAIWYQGESNVPRAERYKDLLTALIGDWRTRWGQGNFPFYLVQLANYHAPTRDPASTKRPSLDDALGRLREAQLQVVQTVPESAIAVAIDTGELSIHPANKQDVGDRLARIALARTYGKKEVQYQSPIYDSMAREGASIRIKFKDCPGGLMVAAKKGLEPAQEILGGKLERFAIAGADDTFVWADAKIEADTVVVSSPAVPEPVSVRYAWAENPEGCNLYGRNGLPASPFRTDALPAPSK